MIPVINPYVAGMPVIEDTMCTQEHDRFDDQLIPLAAPTHPWFWLLLLDIGSLSLHLS